MQKSTLKGLQGLSRVAVDDGTGVGGKAVFVGMIVVLKATGVAVASMFIQDARNRREHNVIARERSERSNLLKT
jgi:hypothetical protein